MIGQRRSGSPALQLRTRCGEYRLLDGFEGKLTTSKYARLAKCSEDTARRDIRALLASGLLRQNEAGGRSTSYAVVE